MTVALITEAEQPTTALDRLVETGVLTISQADAAWGGILVSHRRLMVGSVRSA